MKWIMSLLIVGLFVTHYSKAQQPENKNKTLDNKQQSIVTISAFTAKGDMAELKKSLSEGLDAGLAVNEIKEILVQLYAYAGFPRSLNALQTFMVLLKERESKNIKDPKGKEASPLTTKKSKLQFGTEMQTKLVGRPVRGEVYDFAPTIDHFLKEHLFGDIFGRDNLDWKTRELATISALAALGGVDAQLRSHFIVGRYNGLTDGQLGQLVSIIQRRFGKTEGEAASKVLQTVLTQTNYKMDTMNKANGSVENEIFPRGQKAPQEYFSGNAWVNRLVPLDETGNYSIGNVVFEPGCRNNWHIHPAGQILIVLDGKGWYQEKGSPARLISKGEVVTIPSNTVHWHGATKESSLTHLAITNTKDGGVKWLEPVSDEEYNSVH